jgi:putative DNA primase/helicase
VANASEVFIVEGEKDADNLNNLGFTTTTNFDGAGKWRDSYTEALRGKKVRIIPDDDAPGRQHADKVATALYGKVASVRIVVLPNPGKVKGFDVSDFIVGQGNPNTASKQLSIMVKDAAEWTPSTEELESKAPLLPEADEKHAGGAIPSNEILHALGRGEDGDAELFIQLHRGRFCYDHADRRWYEFKGHSWTMDRTENAIAAVTDVIRLYSAEAVRQAGLKHKAMVEAQKGESDRHEKLESEILNRIGKLHGRQRKENVLTLAAAGDGSLGIAGLGWDADPWVIGCPNGVVDLKTGELRQGKPTDYIKTVAKAEWTGIDTPCPAWERFLVEVFNGDNEIITYIQTLFGYGLIGDTPLHIIPILWGRGRNGKGTLLEIIKYILGPYAFKAEAEMLLDQKSAKAPNAHNSGILALQGKRIVWTSEVDEGRRFNAAKVKELVGGDTLSGRAAYGRDHKEFRPSHLLLLLTNTKPAANSADYALWQRIHLIEFGISFVENPTGPKERPVDLTLSETLKAEGPGVLAWMVRGSLRFNQERLKVPGEVRAAVERYRAEEDIIGKFIEERCIEKDSAEITKGVLYQAYKVWCEDSGHSALGGKRFYLRMDERFDGYHNGRHQVYIGVGVREG